MPNIFINFSFISLQHPCLKEYKIAPQGYGAMKGSTRPKPRARSQPARHACLVPWSEEAANDHKPNKQQTICICSRAHCHAQDVFSQHHRSSPARFQKAKYFSLNCYNFWWCIRYQFRLQHILCDEINKTRPHLPMF